MFIFVILVQGSNEQIIFQTNMLGIDIRETGIRSSMRYRKIGERFRRVFETCAAQVCSSAASYPLVAKKPLSNRKLI